MNESEQKFIVKFPEEYLGEVMGKLSAEGASPIDAYNDNGIFTIEASHLKSKLTQFQKWFEENTDGKGEFVLER